LIVMCALIAACKLEQLIRQFQRQQFAQRVAQNLQSPWWWELQVTPTGGAEWVLPILAQALQVIGQQLRGQSQQCPAPVVRQVAGGKAGSVLLGADIGYRGKVIKRPLALLTPQQKLQRMESQADFTVVRQSVLLPQIICRQHDRDVIDDAGEGVTLHGIQISGLEITGVNGKIMAVQGGEMPRLTPGQRHPRSMVLPLLMAVAPFLTQLRQPRRGGFCQKQVELCGKVAAGLLRLDQ